MTRPRITFLPADAEAHAAIVEALAKCRDLQRQMNDEARKHQGVSFQDSPDFLDLLDKEYQQAAEIVDLLLAAGMVVDDGEDAEGGTT